MRPTKDRGTDSNPILSKLLKLKYRINDVYRYKDSTGKTHYHNAPESIKSDKTWVMEEISNLRNGGWLSASKMKVANEMWGKYNG